MKVGFYTGIKNDSVGGVTQYAQRVAAALGRHTFGGQLELEILGECAPFLSNVCNLKQVEVPKDSTLSKIRGRIYSAFSILVKHGPIGTRISSYPTTFRKVVRRRGIDLLHVPFQSCPDYGLKIPFIVTLHDLQELIMPQYFSPLERMMIAEDRLRAVEKSSAIVVSFEHVKEDLIRYFNCPPDKIFIIPAPYNEIRFPNYSESKAKQYAALYSSMGDYFLYPAQTWEHKNHLALIEAFEEVSDKADRPLSLVCTGSKVPKHFSKLKQRLDKSPYNSHIHFLGFIEEKKLRWLYEHALGVVIPTLYEAGSFPLIEAMQMCVPVVCARTTSLPETIGDERFLFDPENVSEIASSMLRLALDEKFRLASQENSVRRMKVLNEVNVGAAYESLWLNLCERLKIKM